MTIGGFQKSSLIDYPKKISAVVFTQGCNFRCHYCHNPELISLKSKNIIDQKKIFEFLKTRMGKIDAVVITGGEPTVQPDLDVFLYKVKKMGFLTKLDTNGSNPKMVKKLIKEKLLDYIAMDVKAPLEKYAKIIQVKINQQTIKKCINHILGSDLLHEFRTTITKKLLTKKDILEIGKTIKSAKNYFLQAFQGRNILNSEFAEAENYEISEMELIKNKLANDIENIGIRF